MMRIRALWFVFAVLPCLIVGTERSADAGSYLVSGEFGNDVSGTTGLAGGSFSGTFSVTGLPVSGSPLFLDSFDVDFYTAAGALFGTLSSLDVNESSGVVRTVSLPGVGTVDNLVIEDYAALQGQGLALGLNFASPFDGVGDVIPFSAPLTRVSAVGVTDIATFTSLNYVAVVSGASVPEPSSLVLCLIGAMGAFGHAWRRAPRDQILTISAVQGLRAVNGQKTMLRLVHPGTRRLDDSQGR